MRRLAHKPSGKPNLLESRYVRDIVWRAQAMRLAIQARAAALLLELDSCRAWRR